jgi:carboxymethylenebutenolidase
MADKLAAAGFVALAPDLYHGHVAGHTEMDKAAQLMNTMPPDRAGRDMSGAVDYLAGRPDVKGTGIGVVGFCMGGMLSFLIAANRGDKVKAVVPAGASALEEKLRKMGKDVTLKVHPGTGHAFMGPHNALGTLNEKLAEQIWPEVISFLKGKLS